MLAQSRIVLPGLGCRIKANCPLVGPRPVGGVLSVGVLARIYASFGETHGKLRTARSTSATGN